MARATEILDLYIPSYYAPWWVRLETKKHGIYVMVDDPDSPVRRIREDCLRLI